MKERGLAGSVDLPGAARDVGAQLDGASVFVLSSRHEGFPMTILEALGKGVPVVGFDCPDGPREILTQAGDGFLVPPNDTGALAAAIGRLIQDDTLRRRMGARGLETAQRFDGATIAAHWARLLADLTHPPQHIG